MSEAAPQAAATQRGALTITPALEALRWNWGDAYEIWHDSEDWHARRRDRVGRLPHSRCGWVPAGRS
jgi:hypothetical protein